MRPSRRWSSTFDGTDYWLADGFHRVGAARKIGRETIEAEIKDGSARDAILHGIGSNASHGLRRTQADKQRAVERLLKDPEWARWSDRKIAEVAKVDHKTVGKIRRDLSGEFPTGKSLRWGNPQTDWQAEWVGLCPRKRPRHTVGRGSDRRMPQARTGGGRCLTTTRSRRSPRRIGKPVKDLLGAVAGQRPVLCGVESGAKAAQWFAGIWQEHGAHGAHLRRIHYRLVSAEHGRLSFCRTAALTRTRRMTGSSCAPRV